MADIIFCCIDCGTNVIDDDEAISCDISSCRQKRDYVAVSLLIYFVMVGTGPILANIEDHGEDEE
ncbi:hypothetical protein DPMN_171550 [Dreissena polymorpha]|uniref:Uncharacterized protein n=1 Tax=Dreissena polymorpha TaxID=45954 RepID=A0A9D4DZ53_DREPO|nr:hypothetical protein DPMN_171550 [Dreissena polymorpha]